jgi:hypothetical protein
MEVPNGEALKLKEDEPMRPRKKRALTATATVKDKRTLMKISRLARLLPSSYSTLGSAPHAKVRSTRARGRRPR